MDLFRLTFTTLIARKVWVVAILAAVLFPLVAPHLVPAETNTKLIEPARAQSAWTVTWLIGILWTLSQAARFGDTNSRTGVGAYFRSQGCGAIKQILGMWSAIMLFLLPIVACAVLVCLLFAMPGDSKEASMWVATNLQFAVLFLLTIGPLALLGVGLSSRFGALVGYVLPTSLCLYGLYGVGYVRMTMRDSPVLEWVYALSPQYHLADLTPRLIFKMGSLTSLEFFHFTAYFLAVTVVLGSFATLLFRTDPLRS
jgi:hypothetical protein